MSPQDPSFNRGKWADLEAKIRSFIRDRSDTLYVVTGPVFSANKGFIGSNQVTVPGFYYKAVYCPKRGMIAYVMPNRKITERLDVWVTSVDLVEALTGINFFYQLPDEIEIPLETEINPSSWAGSVAPVQTYTPASVVAPATQTPKASPESLNPALCKAITKSGTQCSREPGAGSEYCWQHQ